MRSFKSVILRTKYGFIDFVKFPTIPALVEHFSRVPLTEYSARLDITLAHPISRFAEVGKQLSGMSYYYYCLYS